MTAVARAVLLVIALALSATCGGRTPDRWEIPAGYVGWAIVQYESPTCGSLPLDHGYKVIRMSERGRACTSEKQEEGDAFDKFFYVDTAGRGSELDQRTFVWAGVYSATTKRSFHFIGTEAEYRASPDNSAILDQRCSADPRC